MNRLEVRDLRVTYRSSPPVQALDGISLDVAAGRCLGLLGESGSGKSSLARALLGLLADAHVDGELRLDGIDLARLDEAGWRAVRWSRLSLVFQSTAALNPVLRVGAQVSEPLVVHLGLGRAEASSRGAGMLARVGLGEWAAERYPAELSGGQRRLALLAMALACDPDVLVLDEPTAGLDPVTRANVLALLGHLRAEEGKTLVLLTHDVEAVAGLADEVAVLYRGWVAEQGPTATVLGDPRAPYSWGLLNARPTLASVKDLRGIRGDPPDPTEVATGCPFSGRCTQVIAACADGRPPRLAAEGEAGPREVACVRRGLVPVVRAEGLRKTYRVRTGTIRHRAVHAVNGVNVHVREGEVVGLVGPNGAGKSTVAKLLLRLLEPDGGTVELEGQDLFAAAGPALKQLRGRAQMLFQDPYEALSARLTVGRAVREPLDVQGVGTADERDAAVDRVLTEVRLAPASRFAGRYPHELSGGQVQRVALARALVLEPKLLVADEPLEGLDPSEQAKVLQLLKGIQVERGMAMVLVSHNLAVVLRVADRVYVFDGGHIVEEATSRDLLARPRHPVTVRLLEAAGREALVASGPLPTVAEHQAEEIHDQQPMEVAHERA